LTLDMSLLLLNGLVWASVGVDVLSAVDVLML
jgi:hypothetical protein